MNTSGSTSERTFNPRSNTPCSANACITKDPKRPIEPSSMASSTSLARQPQQQIDVQLVGEAGVHDRLVDSPCAASSSAALRHSPSRAPYETRATFGAFAHDAALADLERLALFRHWHAAAFAPRIAQGRRSVVDRHRRCHHVHQIGFVLAVSPSARKLAGSRDTRCRTRRRELATDAERDRRGAHGEAYRQAPGWRCRAPPGRRRAARTSSRSRERLVALGRQPGGERDAHAARQCRHQRCAWGILGEQVEAGARRHGRGDGDDLVVLAGFLVSLSP